MGGIKSQVARAAKWSSVTEIAARLAAPVTNMILARLLLPEAFGAVATITMIVSFAEIFADAGFQKFLIQREFSDEAELDESTNVAFWTNLFLSAVLLTLVVLFRNPLARFAGNADLGPGVAVASSSVLMLSFSSIQTARFKRDFNFKILFFVRVAAALIPLAVTVPLAAVFRNYWALIIGTLCSQLVQAIMLTVCSKWKPKLRYSVLRLKEMLSFSLWTLAETISIWLTSYIGTFIVGNMLNEYYLGLYKTSMTAVNACMAVITGATTPVLFSALSRLQKDEKQFRGVFFKFQRLVAMLVLPMGTGLFLYRGLATEILLGPKWSEAADFVGLWALMSGLTIIFSHYNSEVFRSKGKPKLSLLTQLIHLTALIPTLMLGALSGFHTLYIARSLVRFQLIAAGMVILWIVFKIKPWEILQNVTPALLSTLVMTAAALLLQRVNGGIVWEFVSILLCILVYAGCILSVPKMRRELLEIDFVQGTVGKFRQVLQRLMKIAQRGNHE